MMFAFWRRGAANNTRRRGRHALLGCPLRAKPADHVLIGELGGRVELLPQHLERWPRASLVLLREVGAIGDCDALGPVEPVVELAKPRLHDREVRGRVLGRVRVRVRARVRKVRRTVQLAAALHLMVGLEVDCKEDVIAVVAADVELSEEKKYRGGGYRGSGGSGGARACWRRGMTGRGGAKT
eukprot:scaffold112670_cov75-Phaeocystis_antarctica.AAC.2